MRTRHRMPMIFSLSMMDVFCCTLGCVILLWLVNQREAMLRTRAASEAGSQLIDTRARLAAADRDRDDLRRQLAGLNADLDQSRRATDETRADLAAARAKSDDLTQKLTDLRAQAADTEDRLAKKTLAEQQLTRQQAAAQKRQGELERLVRDRELQNENAARRLAELTERLEESDARAAQLKKVADALPDLRDAAASARESASAAATRVKALERDLADTRGALEDARGALESARTQSRDLAGQMTRMRAAAEQRFEGIALTGRRVVFLVDMSGSMDLVDDRTRDASKWPGVRETVLRIMRSLPQLEKFQIIMFSDRATFPMGLEGRWLDYDAKTSGDHVKATLAAIEPKGNTNMYAALEAAFQYRPQGLDTVYLLSDGLPNIGTGLTAEQARTLGENQRTEILSRVVRTALKTRWNAPQPGRPRVRINAVGFFYESPDVGAFLWALARENDGSFVGMSKP
jgi:uncharacterized coiled-coil DUF342 family protein